MTPKKLASVLAEDISTPRSLTVEILSRYDEWDQLVNLRVDPNHYLEKDRDRLFVDTAITDLLRKWADAPTTVDKSAVARKAFWDAEKQCAITNSRLTPYLLRYYSDEPEPIIRFIGLVRRILCETLGECPKAEDLSGRFGPGSVLETKFGRVAVPDKISGTPTITEGALKFLPFWARSAWGRRCSHFDGSIDLSVGNRFTTVPKDATKDRGICVEPSINGFYQLAVGRSLRKALKGVGIDLESAQTLHRDVARRASMDMSYSTIDLSNASDTVSYNLVKLLLPDCWFELLDSLRSPFTVINGENGVRRTVKLQKFSSMGNGFTFELETLIFWGLFEACRRIFKVKERIHVFGDDILLPTSLNRLSTPVLKFFGFSENPRKTFKQGYFRESCGGDFFKGVNVRPYYLKETPHEPCDFIRLANGLYRVGCQGDFNSPLDSRFGRAWVRVITCIPTASRHFGPPDLGDIVIHSPDRWKRKTRQGIHFVKTWSPTPDVSVPLARFDDETALASLLYGVTLNPDGTFVRRGARQSFRSKWVARS